MNLPNDSRIPISHRFSDLHNKVVLTYDNMKLTDGAGAQLQRIYGTYSISRLLNTGYLHTPLGRIDYQGLAALERNAIDPDYHRQFNDLFRIESDVGPTDDFHRIELRDISIESIDKL